MMKLMPLVTIAVPIYNAEKYLKDSFCCDFIDSLSFSNRISTS